jgi:hypothetical protein
MKPFLVACALAALVASATMLYLGDARGSVAAIIVAGSALTFARTRAGDPSVRRRHWLGFGLLGSGLLILGFPIGVVTGSFVVLFALQLLLNTVVARRVGQITLERLDLPAVMPGAGHFVQQFSDEGFRLCGSYRFRAGGHLVFLTVMAGPQSDRLAVVTDKVVQVTSRFGRRSVVTTNSAVAPVPPDVLRQYVAGGPAELVRVHDAALALLDQHSIRPDVFANDAAAVEAVREMEERALAFIGRVSMRTALRMETEGVSATRPLGSDGHSLSRINSWIGA